MRMSVLLLSMLVAFDVHAQVCGDADGSGHTTVTDGVQVLRAAADLSSECRGNVCDLDGNGSVTVSDGVQVLRRAAQLSAQVSCGTGFGKLVKTIVVGGVPAELQIGDPPTPDNGAPQNVFSIDGLSKVQSGQTASFTVQLARPVDSLVIALQENGAFVDGFAEVPTGNASTIDLTLEAADVLEDTTVDLNVGTRVGGQIGGFQSKAITVVASSTAAPSTCGDGVVEAGERCDGNDLGGASCESLGLHPGELFCKADCTFRTLLCASAEEFCGGFFERPSDPSTCGFSPASICIEFNDAYLWEIQERLGNDGPGGFLGPCQGNLVMTAVGINHWYLHILDTNLVRID